MQKQINSVKEFHTAFAIGHSEVPKADLGTTKNILRYELMREENEEYFEAVQNITLDKKPPLYSATIIDNKYSIGFVWDESLRDKLSYGDEIIRVDSFVLDQMEFCDIVKIKNFRKDNQSYEIEVKSKDNSTTQIVKIE